MKAFKLFILSLVTFSFSHIAVAQTKSETFKVAGECGMCKSKIEAAAKQAGVSYALWNEDTKDLTVKYKATSTNTAKIQETIAKVGYDTPGYKATDEAYNKLHSCCKYDRTAAAGTEVMDCCKDGKCTAGDACCKDGKCVKELKAGTELPACCKKS